MKTRIISAVVLFPVLLFIVASGGAWLQVAVIVLGLIGMHEFYQAFSKGKNGLHCIGYVFALIYGIFIKLRRTLVTFVMR